MGSTMMKIEPIPQYAEVEVLGITKAVAGPGVNGSKERRPFTGRRILTETAGFDPASTNADRPAAMIAGGDGSRVLQTARKAASTTVEIVLGNGVRSRGLELVDALVFNDTRDNRGSTVVAVRCDGEANAATLAKIEEFAPKMVAVHPNSFGDWWLESNGARAFVYFYGDVDAATGRGVPRD